MKKCYFCRQREATIIIEKAYCQTCFLEIFENKAKRLFEKYHLANGKMAIAMSGGKDSVSLAFITKKLFPQNEIVLLHLNLGIDNSSEEAEKFVRKQAEKIGLPLIVFNLQKELGFTIPQASQRYPKICGVCSTIKRYLLNKMALEEKADVLLTGHHLDDFLLRMFSTIINGNFEQLVRMKPFLPSRGNLLSRGRPFYKTLEKAIIEYARINDISYFTGDCPLRKRNSLAKVEKAVEALAEKPIEKYGLIASFLKLSKALENSYPEPELKPCEKCQFLTTSEICAFCRRTEKIKENNAH